MCMIDDGDRSDVWREVWRKARKDRKCGECNRVISKGEKYRYITGLQEGSWFDGSQCIHCTVIAHWLSIECHGYLLGAVWEDFEEHATNYNDFSLLRRFVEMRKHWRRKDGSLYPVPVLPYTSEALNAWELGGKVKMIDYRWVLA